MDTEKPKRRVFVRKHHSPETWALARADYEVHSLTMPAIAERYGMNVNTVKKRAYLEKWNKTTALAPPPALPEPPADQVKQSGDGRVVSRWMEIAHAAQCPPPEPWSTWLFQGGRGAAHLKCELFISLR